MIAAGVEMDASEEIAGLPDEVLMGRFVEFLDEQAFEVLAGRYYPRGLKLAEQRLDSAASAQDAVQEAFIRIVKNRRRYKSSRPFGPWFNSILRNVCCDIYRRQSRYSRALDCLAVENERNPEPDRNTADTAARIMESLANDDARILKWRYFQGLSIREISCRLGCSLEAAKKRLQRIMGNIRSLPLDEIGQIE